MVDSLSTINGWDGDNQFGYSRVASLLYNTPLMIDPGKADVIHEVMQRYATGQMPDINAAIPGQRVANKPYHVTSKGIAIINVNGSLVHRAFGLDAMSGLTSYQRLGGQLATAEADMDVRAVLLDVDSPGGSVSGLFDLVALISRVNDSKPVWSVANEAMFSAAYAIGAATSKILAPATAMLGSIGVIMMHLDRSDADKKAGRKYTPIFAGSHKADGSSHAPLSDSAHATMQSIVDDNYDIFVDHVAAGRGMDAQAVRDTEAQIYMASNALDVGLVDGLIGSFGEAISMLESAIAQAPVSSMQASACTTQETVMSDKEKAEATATANKAQLDAARAEGHAAGITDERARATGILDHAKASANFAQAGNAIKTGLTLEQATGVLDSMPEAVAPEATGQLAAAMAALGNPDVAADAGDGGDLTEDQLATNIVNLVQPNKAMGGK